MNDVYGMSPVNSTAAIVTSQAGCSDELTLDQRRVALVDRSTQLHNELLLHHKKSKERIRLGLERFNVQEELAEVNRQVKALNIINGAKIDDIGYLIKAMKLRLTGFQYNQIIKLSKEMQLNQAE